MFLTLLTDSFPPCYQTIWRPHILFLTSSNLPESGCHDLCRPMSPFRLFYVVLLASGSFFDNIWFIVYFWCLYKNLIFYKGLKCLRNLLRGDFDWRAYWDLSTLRSNSEVTIGSVWLCLERRVVNKGCHNLPSFIHLYPSLLLNVVQRNGEQDAQFPHPRSQWATSNFQAQWRPPFAHFQS